jgi:hypothetical protein
MDCDLPGSDKGKNSFNDKWLHINEEIACN